MRDKKPWGQELVVSVMEEGRIVYIGISAGGCHPCCFRCCGNIWSLGQADFASSVTLRKDALPNNFTALENFYVIDAYKLNCFAKLYVWIF